MRSRLLKEMKKVMAVVTMAALVLTGALLIPTEARAEESVADEVQFVPVKNGTFKDLIDAKKAPDYNGENNSSYGYLFGGWYEEQNETKEITSSEGITAETVYAKFVPAYVMGVKCQNDASTPLDGSQEETRIRVVSSIDSARYSEVGMIVDKITLTEGVCTTTKNIYKGPVAAYNGKLLVYKSSETTNPDKYEAKDVFGAKSKYFTAANLTGITEYDMVICVQPYWKTLDGTMVTGLSRYVRVNDGVKGYISVPVNLNSETKVAAGLLSINIKNLVDAGYELDTVEGGTVFSEMAYNIAGNTVKCVGNISDINADAPSNNIFANLRFKPADGAKGKTYSSEGFYKLEVTGEDFTNLSEADLDGYDVWNIQY